MSHRSLLSSSYVPLPSLLSPSSANGGRSSLSTYAPPIAKEPRSQPFLPPLDDDQRAVPSLSLQQPSRPASSSSTSRSRPASSHCCTPAASSLRSALTPSQSRGQSRQGKRATFADSLTPLDADTNEAAQNDSADGNASSRSSSRSAVSSTSADDVDRLLWEAEHALADSGVDEQQSTLLLRRERASILLQLKRADKERVDMARELYDEVQMAMDETAKEEEKRRSQEREERERSEERRRLRDEKRRDRKESDLIETLSSQQLLHILDCFPPASAHHSQPRPATSAHSYNLQLFLDGHHSLHHLMFRNAPSSCAEAAVISVEWTAPPSFHHVLSRHLSPTQLPAYLHADLDVLDPSSSALLGFLSAWLRSYSTDRASFSSLSNFLALKLHELSSVTCRLSSPNSLLTFISVDALLLFISSLPGEQVRLQVLLTLLLDMLLLAVYTKHDDTGSGKVRVRDETYSTRVRTLDALLDERKAEHRRMAHRMHSMHEQWVKVLKMWQPAVARAIARWQLPIKALAFQSWLATHHKRRWRLSDEQRSMSTLVRTLRRRWEMRHNMRVAFLEWRQQAIGTRLARLQEELRTLDRINGDKGLTLQRVASSSAHFSGECARREKEVEEGVLRTEMMKVQLSEYDEMLAVYGVQEEEAARLVELFGALMLRGVEEFEVQAVQTYYGHWHDVQQLGELEPLPDATADDEQSGGAGSSAEGGSGVERKKNRRQLLASLVHKKKASSSASRKSRRELEQSEDKSFLRVWTAHQYRRFAHLFPSSAASSAVPQLPEADAALVSLIPPRARDQSLTVPVTPEPFALAGGTGPSARSQSAAKRRSTVSAGASGTEVAASFLNALRSLQHAPFPLAPFSSRDSYLAHHSHERIVCVDRADEDEQQREDRLDTLRRLREATDSEQPLLDGALSPEMEHLLSLSYADGQQSLPSLFSFMPDTVFPLPLPLPLPSPYCMPFAQPAAVRAPHYMLQAILALPTIYPAAVEGAHSAATVAIKAVSALDMELVHASCLQLLYSYPCLPFDVDDDLCHLSELCTLAQTLALSPRQQLMRLHSDVMKVVLQQCRAWRKRCKARRLQLSEQQRLFVAHVRRAEEDVTKRLMRKIRDKDAGNRVMQPPQQSDKEAEAGIGAAGHSSGSPAMTGDVAPTGRVEDAFGAVEVETVVELTLDDNGAEGTAEGKKALSKRRKDRHTKGSLPQPATETGSTPDKPTVGGSAAASSAASAKSGHEYEAEKAEDEAESAELGFDADRLHDACQQCVDRIKVKAAEEKERRDKKKGKKRDSLVTPAPGTEAEAAGGAEGACESKEVAAVVADEEDEDGLFGEDEAVQCEEAVLKYIADIRRLYRNSCETDDVQSSPALPTKTLAAATPSSAQLSSKLSAAGAGAAASIPQWCMSKVHLGRLVRKYKLLGKACSAQFIDQLWDDKQNSKGAVVQAEGTTGVDGRSDPNGAAAEGDGWINFDDFLELLLLIGAHKYSSSAPTLLARLTSLLTLDLFPSLSRPSPLADFRTSIALTCEPTFDKHNKFLSTVFRAYSSDRESNGGVQEPAMTRRDFDDFIDGTGLLQRKVLAVRTVAVLWASAQMDDDEAGGGGGGGAAGADLFGGSSSMVFWEFLEAIAAMACFFDRDPFLPVETRLDAFVEFLQDGCHQIESKRRMYTAKVQGAGGSGTVGAAVVKGKTSELGGLPAVDSPAATRPGSSSKR